MFLCNNLSGLGSLYFTYFTRDGQVIFVSFFFRPAALQMHALALATPALCALQVKKINSPKFHLSIPSEVCEHRG
jgi:hypothetical protein